MAGLETFSGTSFWLLAAAVMFLIEYATNFRFRIFLLTSISAIIVATMLHITNMTLFAQWLVFLVSSVSNLLGMLAFFLLNSRTRRATELLPIIEKRLVVGGKGVMVQDISEGSGIARINGVLWPVKAKFSIRTGSKVMITCVESNSKVWVDTYYS
jgi:membrane protein implicated in regulation of membrane protease activity